MKPGQRQEEISKTLQPVSADLSSEFKSITWKPTKEKFCPS